MGQAHTRQARRARPERTRRDGWTAERQLCFLDALAESRSVSRAAACAGMSRESAHRLLARSEGSLFALLWDRALAPDCTALGKDHTGALTDGRLARLLGNHFRRENGEFVAWAQAAADRRAGDRT